MPHRSLAPQSCTLEQGQSPAPASDAQPRSSGALPETKRAGPLGKAAADEPNEIPGTEAKSHEKTLDQNKLEAAHATVAKLSAEQLVGHLAQLDANVMCKTISPELYAALLSANAVRARELAEYRMKRLKEPKWSLQLVDDELRLVQNVGPFA